MELPLMYMYAVTLVPGNGLPPMNFTVYSTNFEEAMKYVKIHFPASNIIEIINKGSSLPEPEVDPEPKSSGDNVIRVDFKTIRRII